MSLHRLVQHNNPIIFLHMSVLVCKNNVHNSSSHLRWRGIWRKASRRLVTLWGCEEASPWCPGQGGWSPALWQADRLLLDSPTAAARGSEPQEDPGWQSGRCWKGKKKDNRVKVNVSGEKKKSAHTSDCVWMSICRFLHIYKSNIFSPNVYKMSTTDIY